MNGNMKKVGYHTQTMTRPPLSKQKGSSGYWYVIVASFSIAIRTSIKYIHKGMGKHAISVITALYSEYGHVCRVCTCTYVVYVCICVCVCTHTARYIVVCARGMDVVVPMYTHAIVC